MIQLEDGKRPHLSDGSVVSPRRASLVFPHENGLAVVIGRPSLSWIDTEQFKTAPIRCGHFAVSAVPFLTFQIGLGWVGAAPLNAFLMQASLDRALSGSSGEAELVFAITETQENSSSTECFPKEERPAGGPADVSEMERATEDVRDVHPKVEPEEKDRSSSPQEPLAGRPSDGSSFQFGRLDEEADGVVRATRTGSLPVDLIERFYISIQVQRRAYPSGKKVSEVIKKVTSYHSKAEMVSRSDLTLCSAHGPST